MPLVTLLKGNAVQSVSKVFFTGKSISRFLRIFSPENHKQKACGSNRSIDGKLNQDLEEAREL